MESLKFKFVLGAKYDDGKHKLGCLALFSNIMPAGKTRNRLFCLLTTIL